MTPLRKCRVCGLEAVEIEDLELFKKRTGYPHNRLTICKSCNKKQLKRPPDPFLRKCRVCGLEAHEDEGLINFVNHKKQRYKKDNLCRPCANKQQKERSYHTDELVNAYKKRAHNGKIYCYFCGVEVAVLDGKTPKSLVNHSLDRNHHNWNHDNKVPAHLRCHSIYHSYSDNTAQYIKKWRENK